MGDKTKGLYGKFIVRRTDGRDHPGEKHDGCEYFVLDLSHDPHAYPALMAYAASCSEDYPLLASDLRAKAILMREAGVIPETIQELRDVEERMSAAADELERTQKLANYLGKIIHDMTVANQAAWIEWQHGNGADAAMSWIHNLLFGADLLPPEGDPRGKDAQEWYDANRSGPF